MKYIWQKDMDYHFPIMLDLDNFKRLMINMAHILGTKYWNN